MKVSRPDFEEFVIFACGVSMVVFLIISNIRF